jgi:hypothetical protein
MTGIILIYPPEMFRDPAIIEAMRAHGLPSPISIQHSLTACDRCGKSGWIGPKQREAAAAGFGEVVCFYCLTENPPDAEMGVISLNPDIDQVPRRVGGQ